jgi:hypothetical protein
MCPVVGFGVEPLCSAIRQLIRKMDLMETDCEDGRRMELGEGCVQWWGLVLAAFIVLMPES